MSLPNEAQEALRAFAQVQGWEARSRLLLQWSQRLPELPQALCDQAHRVPGCQSPVWLDARQQEGRWHFRGASQARLVGGLLALLLIRLQGMGSTAIERFDLADWLGQLGLSGQLSASRSNGLKAIWKQLRESVGLQ